MYSSYWIKPLKCCISCGFSKPTPKQCNLGPRVIHRRKICYIIQNMKNERSKIFENFVQHACIHVHKPILFAIVQFILILSILRNKIVITPERKVLREVIERATILYASLRRNTSTNAELSLVNRQFRLYTLAAPVACASCNTPTYPFHATQRTKNFIKIC